MPEPRIPAESVNPKAFQVGYVTSQTKPTVDETLDLFPPPFMPDVSGRPQQNLAMPTFMDTQESAKNQESAIIPCENGLGGSFDNTKSPALSQGDSTSDVTFCSGTESIPNAGSAEECVAKDMPNYMWGVPCTGESARSFMHDYVRRCHQTPQTTFRIVLASSVVISFAGSVIVLSSMEYLLYYVSHDVSFLSSMEAAVRVPQALIKGFFFPFLGRAVDSLARKKLLCFALWAGALQVALMAFIPSLVTIMIAEALTVIRDASSSFVLPSLTRDLFPKELWEVTGGGYTNIMAKVLLWNTSSAVLGVFFAGGVFTFSLLVFGHVSEYSLRKDQCSETRCVPAGQYSWSSPWGIDGSLRVLMIFSATLFIGVAAVITFALPETLPKEQRKKGFSDLQKRWPELLQPWSNIRCFATLRLRLLLVAQQLQLMQKIGMVSMVFALQRRFEFNSLEMAGIAVVSILGALPPLLMAKRIVERYGDLRGIWIPAFLFIIGACVILPFIPFQGKWLVYIVTAVTVAPGSMLATMMDALLAKLFPSNVQATWRTGKGFVYQVLNASLVFPFNFVLNVSKDWPFPFDLCVLWLNGIIVTVALLVALYVTVHADPHEEIKSGHALDDFLNSSYGMAFAPALSVTSSTASSVPSARDASSTASSLDSIDPSPHSGEVVGHAAE